MMVAGGGGRWGGWRGCKIDGCRTSEGGEGGEGERMGWMGVG